MYVLGVHDSHNSTACLIKDGKIEACASEERFKRIKNYTGIPSDSINYILNFCKIKPEDLDLIVLSSRILALPIEVEINKTNSIAHNLLRILNKGMLMLPENFYLKLYNRLAPIYYGTKKRKK
ncbi:MAG: carbamoyltransferase N-terminal domain-containing protein, partial [Candidatus Aenigmatarchaeota archaeon]